jgi:hypothetical protein
MATTRHAAHYETQNEHARRMAVGFAAGLLLPRQRLQQRGHLHLHVLRLAATRLEISGTAELHESLVHLDRV